MRALRAISKIGTAIAFLAVLPIWLNQVPSDSPAGRTLTWVAIAAIVPATVAIVIYTIVYWSRKSGDGNDSQGPHNPYSR